MDMSNIQPDKYSVFAMQCGPIAECRRELRTRGIDCSTLVFDRSYSVCQDASCPGIWTTDKRSMAMVYTEDRLYHMACCSQCFSECSIDTHVVQQRAIEDLSINIVTKRDSCNQGEPERAVISMVYPLKDITKSNLYEPRKKYKTFANALIANARDVGGESLQCCLFCYSHFFFL